jgi:hypothetical protein
MRSFAVIQDFEFCVIAVNFIQSSLTRLTDEVGQQLLKLTITVGRFVRRFMLTGDLRSKASESLMEAVRRSAPLPLLLASFHL